MSTARITKTTRCPRYASRYLAVIPAEMIEGLPAGCTLSWEVYQQEYYCDVTEKVQREWRDMLVVSDDQGNYVAGCYGVGFEDRYTRKSDLIYNLGFVAKIRCGKDWVGYEVK